MVVTVCSWVLSVHREDQSGPSALTPHIQQFATMLLKVWTWFSLDLRNLIVAAIRMLNFWSCNFFGLRRLPNTLSSCPFTSIWWSSRFGDQQSASGKTRKNLNLQWRKNLWTSDFRIGAMGRCAAIALLVLLLGVEGGCQAAGKSFWGNSSNEESKSANVANRRY